MSRYKFRLKPAGAIAPDLDLTLRMPFAPDAPAPSGTKAAPCVTRFNGWGVTILKGNEEVFGRYEPTILIREDAPDRPLPYPDGCFRFRLNPVGTLCEGDAIAWEYDDGGANLPYLGFTNEADGVIFRHTAHVLATPSVFDGSSIVLRARLNGALFGVPVYLHCDPTAYTYRFESWAVVLMDLLLNYAVGFNVFTFQEYQGDVVNYWSLNGYIWSSGDTFTWVVTQTVGPAVTLPFVVFANCGSWYMLRAVGESYAGTAFEVQGFIGAAPFGTPLAFSCEV